MSDMTEINNARWWDKKIQGFDKMSLEERVEFITLYESYYIQCQKVLYKVKTLTI